VLNESVFITLITMTIPNPNWLTKRGGELRRGVTENTWQVLLNGSFAYQLFVTPAKGQFTCVVTQTNNGKRLDKESTFPTADAALEGGLAELRDAVGW
jgi:hypothetical protein